MSAVERRLCSRANNMGVQQITYAPVGKISQNNFQHRYASRIA
jgi:hypothetical protein